MKNSITELIGYRVFLRAPVHTVCRQTAGTYKPYINGQLASVTPPTCYSADTPCKKATQCCSKLCVAPPKRGPKVCV